MKTFVYKAKNTNGEVISGRMQCEDYNEFLTKIHDRELFCMSHREVDEAQAKALKKLKTKDLAFSCRQLSAMMSAGVTLVKSLNILYKQQPTNSLKQIWLDIYEEVQKGKAFSEALKIQNGVFPDFFISMVSAGESSGSLDIVMERMSEHYLKESKTQNKIKGAMIYPIVLLSLSLVIVTGLFIFILPKFMSLFDEDTLPPLTKFMMGFVDLTKHYWYIFIIGIVAIVVWIIYSLKVPKFRIKFDEAILKMRPIGALIGKVYTGRFSRTLSSLYSSGIPMVECIERSVAVLGNSFISMKFERVVEDVKQGDSLSVAIARSEVFDSMFCSIIYVGEESGALDDILSKISDYYEDEADSAIQKLVSLLEPALIIFLGVIVGLIVASILPALYSSMGSIK